MSQAWVRASMMALSFGACDASLDSQIDDRDDPVRTGGNPPGTERADAGTSHTDPSEGVVSLGTDGALEPISAPDGGADAACERSMGSMIVINGSVVADGTDSAWVCGGRRVQGNGRLLSQTREVGPFSGVRISQLLHGHLRVGPTSLRLLMDENLLTLVETQVRDGTLEIGSTDPASTLVPTAGARIEVAAPALTRIAARGGASLHGESAGPSMSLEASGVGELALALKVDTVLTATASGGGRMRLSGDAAKVVLTASGTSRLESALRTAEAEVKVSGAARVEVHVTRKVRIAASGTASVIVVGDPAEREVERGSAATVVFHK